MLTTGNFRIGLLLLRLGLPLMWLAPAMAMVPNYLAQYYFSLISKGMTSSGLWLCALSAMGSTPRVMLALAGLGFAQVGAFRLGPGLFTSPTILFVSTVLALLGMARLSADRGQQGLASSIRRKASNLTILLVGTVLAFVLLMLAQIRLRVPSGLVALFLTSTVVLPIFGLLMVAWLLRTAAALAPLDAERGPTPINWPLFLGVVVATLAVLRHPLYSPRFAPPSLNLDSSTLPAAAAKSVRWTTVDGRYHTTLGVLEVVPGKGYAGRTQEQEMKKQAASVAAGQHVLYCMDGGKLSMLACNDLEYPSATHRTDDPLRLFDYTSGVRRCWPRRLDPRRKDFAQLGYELALHPVEWGKCVAWEREPGKERLNVRLWVSYPGSVTREMLERRCQVEVLTYLSIRPQSVTLYAGQLGPHGWKPLRSLGYRHQDPHDYTCDSLDLWAFQETRPVNPTALQLQEQRFYRDCPPAKAARPNPQADQLCLKQVKLLAQACMQYARDHQGRWPDTAWQLVPSYLDKVPVCPLNGRWPYAWRDDRSSGHRVECTVPHEANGRFPDTSVYTRGEPDLQECLKHPAGWLKEQEHALH